MKGSGQHQINVGLGLAVVIFIITMMISYWSTVKVSETADRVAHTRQVLEKLEELISTLRDAETDQRGYIITGDERFLELYQAAVRRVDPLVRSVRTLTEDNPNQQRRFDLLPSLIVQRLDTLKEVISFRNAGGFEAAKQSIAAGRGKREMDQIDAIISEMKNEENHLLISREHKSNLQNRKTLLILAANAFLGLTIFFAVFYLLKREGLERRRAEEASLRAGLFLDSIIENIPNMLFVKEAKELRFVRFNKAGEALLGYAKEDLIGKNDHDFFPKEQADFFIAKDLQVLNEGKLIDIPEEPIQTRHQGRRILHTKKIPVLDEGGAPFICSAFRKILPSASRRRTGPNRQMKS